MPDSDEAAAFSQPPAPHDRELPDDASVTGWLGALSAGDSIAAQKIWDRYFQRVVRLAQRRLPSNNAAEFDAEDVALSVFDGLFQALREGRYQELRDRTELWKLLSVITGRKLQNQVRRQQAQKRDARQTVRASEFGETCLFETICGDEHSPDFSAMMAEECRRLIDLLELPQLKQVALLRLDGFGNEEIAHRMSCTRRTVQRQLVLIRSAWLDELDNIGVPGKH